MIANVRGTMIAIESNDMYRVIDLAFALDALVDAWCETQDDVDAEADV